MRELKEKINKIKEVFDAEYYLNFTTTKEKIKRYYCSSQKLYRIFHSSGGQMHFPLYSKEKGRLDINEQCNIINKYLTEKGDIKRVLELGSGQGSNIDYLAKKNKQIRFDGIELYLPKEVDRRNKKIARGDYHDLSMYKNNTFDVVYAIESLCYSTRKDVVFKEVNRVLKPSGRFIIFDGYRKKEENKLSELERTAMKLIDSGMALRFENIKSLDVAKKDFKLVKKVDFTEDTLPYWRRFEKMSDLFIKGKIINQIGRKILSREALGNVISGNLGYILFNKGCYVYMMHVYEKPESSSAKKGE